MTTTQSHTNAVITAVIDSIQDPFLFEKLIQHLLFLYKNAEFNPAGGLHDGGADGVWQEKGSQKYWQISKQKTWMDKIQSELTACPSWEIIESDTSAKPSVGSANKKAHLCGLFYSFGIRSITLM